MNGNKWRNYGLWVSLASAVLLAVQAVGALFGYSLTDAKINEIMVAVNTVLGVLVVLGIVSNPSNGSGFRDEE
jgi:phi LC3 family holin